jgi:hypothetical protein
MKQRSSSLTAASIWRFAIIVGTRLQRDGRPYAAKDKNMADFLARAERARKAQSL